jgi:DNA-directed RNA polymerase subunit RPC12/RpoP
VCHSGSMPPKCDICGAEFEQGALAAHVATEHKASTEPEIAEMRAHAVHKCVKCGANFPSPEALSAHLLTAHRM